MDAFDRLNAFSDIDIIPDRGRRAERAGRAGLVAEEGEAMPVSEVDGSDTWLWGLCA
jgi:hypothetical protein